MVKRPEVLAVIPARGGSKGIPHKNIRLFAGHPLIAWSITAARQAKSVTRVIVSTDDAEIAAVAREYGAEVPFMRPDDLAQDHTLDLPVFQHALAWMIANDAYVPDAVVQLRPTSPVRPVGLVDEAVRLLLENPAADSVRGVVPAGQNPHKMWRIDPESGQMRNLLDVAGISEPYNAPRQLLPQVFWQTGHVDAIRPATIQDKNSMSGQVILPVRIDPRYTVDIDGLSDWQRAEWLVWFGGLEMVYPGSRKRPLPETIKLVVFDFDGVMTDNRVWVDSEGHEFIAAYRSDSMGIQLLRAAGIESVVLSTETDKAVAARCRKIGVEVMQGVKDKAERLKNYLGDQGINPAQVVYVGNDINDLPCFPLVGCAVAVADALPQVLREADMVLSRSGGFGAVREICERILKR